MAIHLGIHMLKRFLLIGLLCFPVAAWMLYKPMRVIAPELNGVSCIGEDICTDNALRYEEAIQTVKILLGFIVFGGVPGFSRALRDLLPPSSVLHATA